MPSSRTKILVSWSGGKDSAWTLHLLRQSSQYEIVALVTTLNAAFRRVAMHGFHEDLLHRQANELALPLWKVDLPWPCSNADYEYKMASIYTRARAENISAIAFGDLFLEDIRAYRVAQLSCTGLVPLFPLWGRPTAALAREMLVAGVRARLTCVDPAQIDPAFAGRSWDAQLLAALPASADPCGENGEFHTFVHAGPFFRCPIPVEPAATLLRDGFAYCDLALTNRRHTSP